VAYWVCKHRLSSPAATGPRNTDTHPSSSTLQHTAGLVRHKFGCARAAEDHAHRHAWSQAVTGVREPCTGAVLWCRVSASSGKRISQACINGFASGVEWEGGRVLKQKKSAPLIPRLEGVRHCGSTARAHAQTQRLPRACILHTAASSRRGCSYVTRADPTQPRPTAKHCSGRPHHLSRVRWNGHQILPRERQRSQRNLPASANHGRVQREWAETRRSGDAWVCAGRLVRRKKWFGLGRKAGNSRVVRERCPSITPTRILTFTAV